MKVAFIIPTKDRPTDLERMLQSLATQTRRPDQVIVIDASERPAESVVRCVDELSADYVRWEAKPSAAAQRNAGLTLVRNDMDLVCFFDDDQILRPDALERMVRFWQAAPPNMGGASFNQANWNDGRSSRWKTSRWSDVLGLYCREPGKVARSGWQSLYGKVERNTLVEWIASGASVWRKEILDKQQFDLFFDACSYLEDLDFSYRVSRRYKIMIVADAMFEHYPSRAGRQSDYSFGKVEARNRLYFVRKHRFSVCRCCLGLLIRTAMSLGESIKRRKPAYLYRALGNCAGLILSLSARPNRGRA